MNDVITGARPRAFGPDRRRALGVAVLFAGATVLAAACGGGSGASDAAPASTAAPTTAAAPASTAPPGSGAARSMGAFEDCMKGQGVTLPDPGAGPSATFPAPTPALASAFQKCRDKMPAGGPPNGPGMEKFAAYMNCIMQNGVAMDHSGNTPMTPPNFDDPTFQKADQACASLRPNMPRPSGK
jgi:hypothetical protein